MTDNALILDCDGVILDSNKLKTDIFLNICYKYKLSDDDTSMFILYHKENGGISRFEKIKVLLSLIEKSSRTISIPSKDQLLNEFSEALDLYYKHSRLTYGLLDFLASKSFVNLFVVSGSEQSQLVNVLSDLGLKEYFLEILGSPTTKYEHIKNLSLVHPNLNFKGFVGDSFLDYEVASFYDIPFYFMSTYSECAKLKKFKPHKDSKFLEISYLTDLLS